MTNYAIKGVQYLAQTTFNTHDESEKRKRKANQDYSGPDDIAITWCIAAEFS
ncbi:MAG: hypothetical protein ACYC7D_04270 [Nitrososphaerales archaeon]